MADINDALRQYGGIGLAPGLTPPEALTHADVSGTPAISYVSVIRPEQAPSGKLTSSIPAAGDSFESMTYKSMISRMTELEKEQDPEKRLHAVALLKGSIEGHIAAVAGNLQGLADAQYNIPDLEQALQENIAADKSDPKYHLYLADSPMTAKIREQLNASRSNSRAAAADMITQSPELAAMNGALGVFLQKESSMAMKLFGEQAKQKDKKEMAMEKAGVRGIALGKLLNPGYTDEQAAIFAVSNSTDKNFQEVSDNIDNPEALRNAFVGGNAQAGVALTEMHAKLKSPNNTEGYKIAKAKAISEIQAVGQLSSTPAGRKELVDAMYFDPEDRKKAMAEVELIASSGAPSGAEGVRTRVYADMARKKIQADNANTFQTNISSWDPTTTAMMESSTILGPIIAAAKPHKPNGQVGLSEIMASISGIQDKAQKSAALNELLMYVKQGVSKANTGIFGNVGSEISFTGDIQSMMAGVDVKATRSSLLDYGRQFLGTAVDQYSQYLAKPILGAVVHPYSALTTPLGEGHVEEALAKTRRIINGK